MEGVECMNDDPNEANALFIKVQDYSNCLQQISDEMADYFIEQGDII